jgi:zinc-finger
MGVRPFRWFPHRGARHAIPDELTPRDTGETLCGLRITVPHVPVPRNPNRYWAACPECDRVWRVREGIPPVFPVTGQCSTDPKTTGRRT